MKKTHLFVAFLFFVISLKSQNILKLKDQATAIEEIQKHRLENLLPQLMKKHNIDMWVLITREYNEDPIVKTLLPPTWLNARRRTIVVFSMKEGVFKSAAITRYPFGNLIPSVWNKEREPNQWKALSEYIISQNPSTIAVNISENYALADGLVRTDFDKLLKVLPSRLTSKIVSSEPLAVSWIETRTPREMIIYNQLVSITHSIIKDAFSNQVITPGITTTEDVVWWLREKVRSLGLSTWFHPTVDVQRKESSDLYSFDMKSKYDTILPGDLLHCDFGISYLTLNTDCQELAYVLRRGEKRAPKELEQALKDGNTVQDYLTNNFIKGQTGNNILKKALNEAKSAGYKPQIYTHPLGVFGHSAGTTIGMWDAQNGIPGSGEHALQLETVYAIELNTKVYIKEWKKEIRVMLEEAGYFGSEGFKYVNGRQTKLILVGLNDNAIE
ncbi:MAG: M24 family metallopeptidase [Flavobacteriaceae bacterium]|nr:M24 family metallopeptidase [Flavobacteriaceae bacterium]